MQFRAALASLVLAMVLSGCSGKGPEFPEAYILQADELPEGLKLSEIPQGMPISSNPAEIPASLMAAMGEEYRDFAPARAFVEFLENSVSSNEEGPDGGLLVAAGFWPDMAQVESAVQDLKADPDNELCAADAPGALLQDGNVLVMITGDETMQTWVPKIIDEIRKDAPNLQSVC